MFLALNAILGDTMATVIHTMREDYNRQIKTVSANFERQLKALEERCDKKIELHENSLSATVQKQLESMDRLTETHQISMKNEKQAVAEQARLVSRQFLTIKSYEQSVATAVQLQKDKVATAATALSQVHVLLQSLVSSWVYV